MPDVTPREFVIQGYLNSDPNHWRVDTDRDGGFS